MAWSALAPGSATAEPPPPRPPAVAAARADVAPTRGALASGEGALRPVVLSVTLPPACVPPDAAATVARALAVDAGAREEQLPPLPRPPPRPVYVEDTAAPWAYNPGAPPLDAGPSRAPRIAQGLLAQRALRYEHLPAVDLAGWDLAAVDAPPPTALLRLRARHVHAAVRFEASCADERLLVTASWLNLDAREAVLLCPVEDRGERDGRPICRVGEGLLDAAARTVVRAASRSPDDLLAALRTGLARLLLVPELDGTPPARDVYPGERVTMAYRLRENDGREEDHSGPRAPSRHYAVVEDVVELPEELVERICAEPEEHWAALACSAGLRRTGCRDSDRVRYPVTASLRREVAMRDGAAAVSFSSRDTPTDYLVRAQVLARSTVDGVGSPPLYRCMRVAPRRLVLDVAARIGWAREPAHAGAEPAATLRPPTVGLDVALAVHLFGLRSRFVPSLRAALVAGVTLLQGSYVACVLADDPGCSAPGRGPAHDSSSVAGDLALQLRLDLVRIGGFVPRLLAEVGLGAEWLTSRPAFDGDGGHALLVTGVGGALAYGVGVRPVSLELWIGFLWQRRSRFSSTVMSAPGGPVDAAGVPDATSVYSLVLGLGVGP